MSLLIKLILYKTKHILTYATIYVKQKVFGDYPFFLKAIKIPERMDIPPMTFQTVNPSPSTK